MTPDQIKLAKALGNCTFPPGTAQKRFARDMAFAATDNPTVVLSDKQDKYLRDMTFRYRRQMPVALILADESRGWSTLQWLAPELAKLGVLKNEEWVPRNAATAVALFKENAKGLHVCAAILAALHPYAIDYLRQAPVIVLAVSHGSDLHLAVERKAIAGLWAPRFGTNQKLRDVMTSVGVAYPLRKLDGKVMEARMWPAVRQLGQLHPSLLAQIIPDTTAAQRPWLHALTTWTSQMLRRFDRIDLHFEWAARHLLQARGEVSVSSIADFAGAQATRFNPRWTFERAIGEMEAWHVKLATVDAREAFEALACGYAWDEEIAVGPMPARATARGHLFVALRSAEALFVEGCAMHHCVLDYAVAMLKGRARFYSVADRVTGKRVATVELVRQRHAIGWQAVQIKGPYNAACTMRVLAAIERFVDKNNGKPRALPDNLEEAA